jgi:hypothetical protein
MKLTLLATMMAVWVAGALAQAPPAPPQTTPTDQEIEQFLLKARIVRTRSAGKGVTASTRATLSDGARTHDAQIQTIDERRAEGPSNRGVEFNFRDSWMFNVAAYRLDRLLGLNFVPVSVERAWRSTPGAFTWWIDDVMMEEGDRLKRHLSPPDSEAWNQEMQLVRVFDQLIYNMDRNVGNLLITNDWRIWAIDHTRAFRTYNTLRAAGDVTRCDRALIERLKQLDRATLSREVGRYLSRYEIDAVLARRTAIVAQVEKAGPAALFDRIRK